MAGSSSRFKQPVRRGEGEAEVARAIADDAAPCDVAQLRAEFANPGASFRGKPFWSWNGRLDEAELLRQIHVFKGMGFGGFFMHSRTGLVTEYLGPEWFRLTNACADAAADLGLEAWLYDEDRWPSGTAGGLVTEDERHRQRFISLRFATPATFAWDDGVLAAFACRRDGLAVRDVRRLSAGGAAAGDGEAVLEFRVEPGEPSSFYNGHTYVDAMSRAATDRYLALTHDRYADHCGDRLGGSIRGIFTDEPHRGPVMCGFSISNANRLWMAPWTATLFDEFRAAFGYDLVDRLPELFLQPGGRAVSPVKWQYMELLQRLFLRNFLVPLHDWCRDHRMALTGHVLHEDTLTAQACMQGSLMRSYEHMHLPGIDLLAEGNRSYWVAKQLSSVARQTGRRWLLSELYGCTGWQMTFENHKAVGDWQALFGINVRCHHLSWYTMEGEAKRDYPASISHQSAWCGDYRHVEDYFARLGLFLSAGEACCDLLVVSPVESVWCQIHGGWAQTLSPQDEPVRALERGYAELFHALAGAQLDFDYGDEEMMSRLARVDRDDAGPVLRLGRAEYRGVVVGRMTTIRGSTVRLLRQFVDAGGTVVFCGGPPAHVDAVPDRAAADLARRAVSVPFEPRTIADACAAATAAPRVEVLDGAGVRIPHVFCQLGRADGGLLRLVAMNVDPDGPVTEATVRVTGAGDVAEWDCETGHRFRVGAAGTGGTVTFPATFAPSGSHAYLIGPGAADGLSARRTPTDVSRRPADGPFAFELTEPNVLVLDRARFRIGDGDWQPAAEVLKVDRAVRSTLGLAWRSGEMVQPWYRARTHPQSTVLGRVSLSFAFTVHALPVGPVDLGIERPERFRGQMNGVRIDLGMAGEWWVDQAIRRVPLPPDAVRLGANELTLEVDFHEGVDLEAVYLLGRFGASIGDAGPALAALPDTLAAGDVVPQGLPFYGGAIRYHIPIGTPSRRETDRLLLELPDVAGACAKVSAPGHAPLMMPWRPFRADVTALAAGVTILDVDVVLTRRNTFGPLHQLPARAEFYGPDSFTTSGPAWSDGYVLLPAGLLAAPVWVDAQS